MKYKVYEQQYLDLAIHIKEHFKEASKTLFDGRNTLKVLSYLDEEIVVKSFKIPHIINKIAYTFFRDSKAKKSYENSVKIIDFVPKPMAYVEFFRFGLLYESYFLSENYIYDFTIREVLTTNAYEDKEKIFEAFVDFSYDLHEHDIEHLDYSPGNILIKKVEEKYAFKIIDVNRMVFRTLDKQARLENFAKLWAKDEDLKTIISMYAKRIDMDENEALEIGLRASQKHKDAKNFKKRLKGKKVVD